METKMATDAKVVITTKDLEDNLPEKLVYYLLDVHGDQKAVDALAEALMFHYSRAQNLGAKLGRVRKTLNETVVKHKQNKKAIRRANRKANPGATAAHEMHRMKNHSARYDKWAAANPEEAAKWNGLAKDPGSE
jgi:hypothetical protein